MQPVTGPHVQQQIRTMTARLPLFLALILGLNCPLSALGETSPVTTPSETTSPVTTLSEATSPAEASAAATSTSAQATQSPGQNTKSSAAHLPLRLVVFTAGAAIGFPIAWVRCTQKELVRQTKTAYQLGGVPKPLGYLSAGFFGIPSGILSGGWSGAFNGLADSWVGSKDGEFSKENISLDKLVLF